MKYLNIVESVITRELDNTNNIRKMVQKKANRTVNWLTINYCLNTLLQQKKIEKVTTATGKVLWKKI